jgi:NAD(P)-dependent dehydrogenase (short-subunit alcohol dehydrogenase family)
MLLGPAAGAPLPEWRRMVELNVLGLLCCAHAALPHLLRAAGDFRRQVADMVNISSVAAGRPATAAGPITARRLSSGPSLAGTCQTVKKR